MRRARGGSEVSGDADGRKMPKVVTRPLIPTLHHFSCQPVSSTFVSLPRTGLHVCEILCPATVTMKSCTCIFCSVELQHVSLYVYRSLLAKGLAVPGGYLTGENLDVSCDIEGHVFSPTYCVPNKLSRGETRRSNGLLITPYHAAALKSIDLCSFLLLCLRKDVVLR